MNDKTLDVALDVKTLKDRHFEGYGAVFGNVDMGNDIVMPGAFKETLAEHAKLGTWPPMFWMHKKDAVPGVWHEIREDSEGLFVKGELVDTQLGNEVYTLLTKKAVRGLSVGYKERDWDYDARGRRLLQKLYLGEVSVVSMAMNPLAQISAVKSRLSLEGEYVPSERDWEQWFREKGCSKSVARTLTARLFAESLDFPGGMLGGARGPGGMPANDDEEKAVLDSLRRTTETIKSAQDQEVLRLMGKLFR